MNDFQKHLEEEHKISTFFSYLKEIVYGGNDGIVTTFAVVAGFAGAHISAETSSIGTITVLLFGLANLFADATSMGLGNFLSLRADADLYYKYRKKEEHKIKHNSKFKRNETIKILQEHGVTAADAEKFTNLYQRNPQFWADFMMDYEVGIENPDGMAPAVNGMMTFGSFLFFGAIPLLPYFFLEPTQQTFYIAIATSLFALFLLGLLRWKATGQKFWSSVGETILVGVVCGVVAYGVGTFFQI